MYDCKFLLRPLFITIFFASIPMPVPSFAQAQLLPEISSYTQQRIDEFAEIPAERQQQLKELSAYVSKKQQADQTARLTFICTHNSRRSHLAQVWSHVAAIYYQVEGVETFSGGTEATAFNPRAIAALRRCGMQIDSDDSQSTNPHYSVRCQTVDKPSALPAVCYSKVFSMPPNPQADFCAVMTCTQADGACPIVQGCDMRIAITYEDPKVGDGQPEEAAIYDARCAQIAREMLFMMSHVKK